VRAIASLGCAAASCLVAAQTRPAPTAAFVLEEATIATVHAAFRAKTLSCRTLVDLYLARIDAFDKHGPALNAITVVNPAARALADDLDRRYATSGFAGPLHCVPMIVKDNFETAGLMSADGSLALNTFVSDRDAFQVRRVKDAGAIVLAKSNMAEFAFSPLETHNSLQGTTKNPYARDRVPAGSSGGTAAAVAANFGLVGLGSDTGNSIRGPSAHTALVGIRSTMGLTSRAGVIPLSYLADIAGPMARSVADAAQVLQVIVGEDPEDPMTARSRGRTPVRYGAALTPGGLKGARLGILRQAYERQTTDPEIVRIFMKAADDLRAAGAVVVESVPFEAPRRPQAGGTCRGFKYDFNAYMAERGQKSPIKSLDDLVASPAFAALPESVKQRVRQAQVGSPQGPESEACRADAAYRAGFGAALAAAMDALKLDALIYPTWSNPPRLITDSASPAGDNSQVHSPTSGFPAMTVPMGYSRYGTLPAGMTLLGRAWDEARLIRLAFDYEQRTKHRRPPRL
jgi:Asp-tRNA(Asn)/Glu-tRNA(Gln) amidotransferase A subunit family amidase